MGVDVAVRLAHFAITHTNRRTNFWGEDQRAPYTGITIYDWNIAYRAANNLE